MEKVALRCTVCREVQVILWADLLDGLRREGRFRRDASPDREMVAALLRGSGTASRSCPSCGTARLELEAVQGVGDWDDAARCCECRRPIEPERLEVLPETTVCSECSRRESPGNEIKSYCKRCGGELSWRSDARRGGYREVCLSCGGGW